MALTEAAAASFMRAPGQAWQQQELFCSPARRWERRSAEGQPTNKKKRCHSLTTRLQRPNGAELAVQPPSWKEAPRGAKPGASLVRRASRDNALHRRSHSLLRAARGTGRHPEGRGRERPMQERRRGGARLGGGLDLCSARNSFLLQISDCSLAVRSAYRRTAVAAARCWWLGWCLGEGFSDLRDTKSRVSGIDRRRGFYLFIYWRTAVGEEKSGKRHILANQCLPHLVRGNIIDLSKAYSLIPLDKVTCLDALGFSC